MSNENNQTDTQVDRRRQDSLEGESKRFVPGESGARGEVR